MDWNNMNDIINQFTTYSFINEKILDNSNDKNTTVTDSDKDEDNE